MKRRRPLIPRFGDWDWDSIGKEFLLKEFQPGVLSSHLGVMGIPEQVYPTGPEVHKVTGTRYIIGRICHTKIHHHVVKITLMAIL